MGKKWNKEWLEVMLPTGRKITNKVIMLYLVIKTMIFTQQYFVLPITNSIILGSDFLDVNLLCWILVIVPSPHIALITCLLPVSPIILYMISTLQKQLCQLLLKYCTSSLGRRYGKIPLCILPYCNIIPSSHYLHLWQTCCQHHYSPWLHNAMNVLVTRIVTIS